jgi:Flavin-binding monooxygenase-like
MLCLLRLPYRIWPALGTLDTDGSLSVPLLVTDERHMVPVRRGEIDMRICQVTRLEPGRAHLSTGDVVDVDMIVMGTGWKLDYSFLDDTTVRSKLDLGADGLWLYRNILPPQVRGLAFVGANCLTFMNMYTAYVQAFWLAELLSGGREWPAEKVMTNSIAKEKAFKRKLYPMCPIRAASVEAYMQQYHDLILVEQGIDPHVYSGNGILSFLQNTCCAILPETMAEPYARKVAAFKKHR